MTCRAGIAVPYFCVCPAWFPREAHVSTGTRPFSLPQSGRTLPPPSRFPNALLCSGGSGCRPFPTVIAPMRPTDSLTSFGRGSGFPRRRPTSARTLFFTGHRMRPLTRARWGLFTGSPCRNHPRKRQGLPGFRAVLFVRAVARHLAGCSTPVALGLGSSIALRGGEAAAFGPGEVLGIPECKFRG